ncbi:hypothetical protein P7H17_16540 [Paenibacillus larvae]|nr:hypothetical protein [Paenibacillus larvae]MDT2287316.1 hypothetical protein [Paenibacillus larvae]
MIDGIKYARLSGLNRASLRGRNWNGVRPDLVICDDLEDKRNTNTRAIATQRTV